jgi:hypothetical protein
MKFSDNVFERADLQRPLGDLSDFVVEAVPALLAGQADAFRAEVSRIASIADSAFFAETADLPEEQSRLACADMAILNQACGHAGIAMPANLAMLLVNIAGRRGRWPTVLYEDCVLNNPVDVDPRLFTAGDTGNCERDFLRLHRRIEDAIGTVIHHLTDMAGDENRRALIAACDIHIKTATECFAAFHAMPRDLFAQFRGFYATPPNGRHLGVSGRFSESINTLRIMLDGKRIGWVIPTYFNELLENMGYYPSTGRKRLMNAIENAVIHDRTFIDSLAVEDEGVNRLAFRLRKFLDTATGIHFQLVKKFVV